MKKVFFNYKESNIKNEYENKFISFKKCFWVDDSFRCVKDKGNSIH